MAGAARVKNEELTTVWFSISTARGKWIASGTRQKESNLWGFLSTTKRNKKYHSKRCDFLQDKQWKDTISYVEQVLGLSATPLKESPRASDISHWKYCCVNTHRCFLASPLQNAFFWVSLILYSFKLLRIDRAFIHLERYVCHEKISFIHSFLAFSVLWHEPNRC